MPYDTRKMGNVLIRKLGAEEEEGSRHIKYKIRYKDQLVGLTVISRGVSEITDNIAGTMAKQLCISLGILRGIYQCPYGWDEYIENYDSNRNPRIPYGTPLD